MNETALCDFYQQGNSLYATAEEFGVTYTKVRVLLKRNKVQIRNVQDVANVTWTPERRAQEAEARKGKPSGALGKSWKCAKVVEIPSRRGENNHFWKGGKTELSRLIRTCAKYKEWRRNVYIAAKHTCAGCGDIPNKENKVVLHCDHIIALSILIDKHFIKTMDDARQCDALWDVSNGRVLCKQCHKAMPTFGRNIVYQTGD